MSRAESFPTERGDIALPAADLEAACAAALCRAGATKENAEVVAAHLVGSSLRGVDTHGVEMLPRYLEEMGKGWIDPSAEPQVRRTGPSSVLVVGRGAFGQVAMTRCVLAALDLVATNDIAVGACVQAAHVGRLGAYVELAASHGCIALAWTGGMGLLQPAAVPYGGRDPVLHTNPVAGAFPAVPEPIAYDFATTEMAGNAVHHAQVARARLPTPALVDENGNPTTDPDALARGGSHLPFGAHKGYAIMVAAELLGWALTGASQYADGSVGSPSEAHHGVLIVLLGRNLFVADEIYYAAVAELGRRVRSSTPGPGFHSVYLPGDMEAEAKARRIEEGIPVSRHLWEVLNPAAAS